MSTAKNIKKYMSETELAEYWHISIRTLQSWRLNGGGPKFLKLGKAIRYSVDEIKRFESENTKTSTAA